MPWRHRLRPWRTALGLILAPVMGGGLGLALFATGSDLISGKPFFGPMMQDTFVSSLALGAVFGAYIGALPSLLVGWPLHVVLLRRRWTHPLAYCALGLVLAFVAFALIGPLFGFGSVYAYQVGAPVLVLAGVIGGLVVWAIRRPDIDARVVVTASP